MLPRLNRLAKKNEYQELYRQGKSAGGRFLLVKAGPNKLGRIRVGIVVSKRAAPKAVHRSKIKRQLRHIVRNDIVSVNSDQDLVIILKKGPRMPSYQDLWADWQIIWSQIKK